MCVLCLSLYILCFFFFKQKTAYEMRISDWSSDVCSSDLGQSYDSDRGRPPRPARPLAAPHLVHPPSGPAKMSGPVVGEEGNAGCILAAGGAFAVLFGRSEEHTSELQSLMRISYAVFCLKKKKHNTLLIKYDYINEIET